MPAIEFKISGGVAFIKPNQSLTTPSLNVEFSNLLDKAVEEGVKEIVIDLDKVLLLNSTALGKLLAFQKKLIEDGASVKTKLINVIPDLQMIFDDLAFSRFFEIQYKK